jgi:hypothetical protein
VTEDLQDVQDIATRTGGRYMGAEFRRRNTAPGEIRVRPTKVITGFDINA